jgi:hypothetical protein
MARFPPAEARTGCKTEQDEGGQGSTFGHWLSSNTVA